MLELYTRQVDTVDTTTIKRASKNENSFLSVSDKIEHRLSAGNVTSNLTNYISREGDYRENNW